MTPRLRFWLGLGLLAIEAALLGRALPSFPEGASRTVRSTTNFRLVPEVGVVHSIKPGEAHLFRAPVERGQVFLALVEQRGVDVRVTLEDPSGRPKLRMDSPTASEGPEHVFAVLDERGMYRLRIECLGAGAAAGRYELRMEKPRVASERDRLRAKAWAELAAGEELRREATAVSRQKALAAYSRSVRLWRRIGDSDGEATAYSRIGRVHNELKNLTAAHTAFRHALALSREPRERADLFLQLGLVEDRQGKPLAALDRFQQALRLARQSHSALTEAGALSSSGYVASNLGEVGVAMKFFNQSLVAWKRAGSPRGRLRALEDFTKLYLQIGELDPALELLREARLISPDRAATLRLLGMTFFLGGNEEIALQFLQRALAQARTEGDAELEATVLGDLASVALRLKDIELASSSFDMSLRISQEKKLPQREAYARAGRGRVLGLQGRFDAASAELDLADRLYRSLGEPESRVLVLAGKASLERQRGNLGKALELAGEAVELIESQRLEVENPWSRAAQLGVWSDPYELQIDVLWHLAQREPKRGFEAEAFEVSEKIRARALYEELAARTISPQSGAPRSALSRFQPLELPQVQSLLDGETALLVFTLAEERSFIWWIEKGSLSMHELPARRELETAALQVQSRLAENASPRRDPQRLQVSISELSQLVLAPVADKLPRVRRLAIVPDGALQAIPFAALVPPRTAGRPAEEPLVARHVLVTLPSPSTLAALRRREAERRTRPDKLIAIIADPVFEVSDSRMAHRSSGESARDLPPSQPQLTRLEHTEKEVGAIKSFVPEGMAREITGFDAVPEAVRDPNLRRYRYLHFGTHGFVDARHPERSAIVLSQVTRDGKSREGRLFFYQVYELNLPFDLVSLSTCRSAAGRQIRREGPITMTRSFFYAGTSRVLGTLWDVKDKTAAELTTVFYEGVLREGKTPGEALRDAQDAMRLKGLPLHDWAAFVLQGDWR